MGVEQGPLLENVLDAMGDLFPAFHGVVHCHSRTGSDALRGFVGRDLGADLRRLSRDEAGVSRGRMS